ncbi:MAG: hypothetical protein ABIM44_09345 [candidate division WOR-3 bacterium]
MPLPKNFAILTKPRVEVKDVKERVHKLDKLMNFPGAWKALSEKWLNTPSRLKDGELSLLSEDEEYRHFRVWFDYYRKGIAAKEYTLERAEFEIWQHRGGISLVVNAPRELAELSATFLSAAIYNDPFTLRARKLSRDDFMALIRHVKSLGGKVTVIQLRYVKTEDMGELSVLKLSGKNMDERNIDRLLSAARKITRVGFQISNLGREEYRFWAGHWGGGTIYTPSMSEPHHSWLLIKFFESALSDTNLL